MIPLTARYVLRIQSAHAFGPLGNAGRTKIL